MAASTAVLDLAASAERGSNETIGGMLCIFGFGIYARGGVCSRVFTSAPSQFCASLVFTPNWCRPQLINNKIVCHMLFQHHFSNQLANSNSVTRWLYLKTCSVFVKLTE